MRQPAPAHVKQIYGEIKQLFGGGSAVVDRYGDSDDDPLWVDVMRTADAPQPGVTSYATLGMSRFDNGGLECDGKPLRVELLAACQSEYSAMADGLVSCALNVAKSGYQVTPGVVHPNVLDFHTPTVVLKHLLLVTPYLWDDAPEEHHFEDITVVWLMAVPISDSEMEVARQHGTEHLQRLLEEHQVDVFDINRPPVTGPRQP